MVGFLIALTEDERRVVNAERHSHPEAHARRKLLVVWLLHCGLTRTKAAEIAGLSRTPFSGTSRPTAAAAWTGCDAGASGVRSAPLSLTPTPSARHSSIDPRGRRPKPRSGSNA